MSEMKVDHDANQIDEGLYSRQLYVLGHDAMKRMAVSNVLIVGLKGLGAEIAKNVALAGVKSVTLYDPAKVEIQDLSSQFFLRPSDIRSGHTRAEATAPRLAELNSYVPVKVLEEKELTKEVLSRYQAVVLTDQPLSRQLAINDITHSSRTHFVAADVRGLFGSVFCDFGEKFPCIDPTGEQPLNGMVTSIDKSADGLVTTLDETRHGLEDGDYVTFSEVQGLEELNGCKPRKVTIKGPYTFTIGDTTGLQGEYKRGGTFTQVKMPKVIDFKSLKESLKAPEHLISDFAKFDRPPTLHAGWQALSAFWDREGRLPEPRSESDARIVLALAKEIFKAAGTEGELQENVVLELAKQARGDLSPMVAFVGGFVGQEVLKACSGKFHPLLQHMYVDSLESLPADTNKLPESDFAPLGTRYDAQIAVFGKGFQEKIGNARQFLVGAGAIGCEMLKNWAMMGLATGPQGAIHVTDMDTIEKSNLNRQFLFRPKDVGSFKADTAAAAVTEMNPDLKGKIVSHQNRVGPETEDVYGDDFFEKLNGVTNALDNVQARQYMDRRCVYYEKPLLESGTLGTKLNTQVVVPHLTESYSSSQDPPEKSIPVCTLKNFPNAIEHTIQWAREKFDELFIKPAENVNQYLTQPDYIETTLKAGGSQTEQVRQIKSYLVEGRPISFEACIAWARLKFEEDYNNTIRQLLFSLPADAVTSSGQPFWSGPKRAPKPITFDSTDPLHLDYVISAANLHAFNYGLRGERDPAAFQKALANVKVPEFTPKSNVKVQTNDNEAPQPAAQASETELTELASSLPPPSSMAGFRLTPVEFEKDVDDNFHIDFIAAAANLRAVNYAIQTADKHKVKGIAGKIIPALITSTSVASGLVCLELYKMLDMEHKTIEDYKNSFVNLALPFVSSAEPIPPAKNKYYDKEWTLWDRFTVPGNPTLGQLIEDFKTKEKLDITMVSSGVSMLYSPFAKNKNDRLKMPMRQLIETISKKPIEPHVKWTVVEIMADDEDGEDVEVRLGKKKLLHNAALLPSPS
ncbi:ubiquitin-activating enzyme E1 [Tilletiaria anomala UBC 951]|uniref:Ubiquitin-activating enzyme E1 1 n=1 Tax=Tilletiaria anomala (strain ATCC 24038 / CBS 436.72 / UBC 951) TaxID=1037660 RepID=A0A066VLX6_TILAU|nr:ubiquitin-activating enzyme E1 [Tilletiaria anomala UBC 951]KDN39754.1 ubiquitin-activating enzyme E1 [Tilletiaria anomala UBC 951]